MGFCDSFVRLILILVNIATVVSGVVLIAVGVLSYTQQSDFNEYTGGTNYTAASIFLIILGIVVLVVGLFGCFGAIKRNKTLLNLYGGFIIFCIVLQIALVVFGFIKKGSIENAGKEYANSTFNNTNYDEMDNLAQKAVNFFQINLKCCGLDGPDFWSGDLPQSCCGNDTTNGTVIACSKALAYKDGCYDAAEAVIKACGTIIIIIAIIILIIEILCLLAGCYSVKNDDYDPIEQA